MRKGFLFRGFHSFSFLFLDFFGLCWYCSWFEGEGEGEPYGEVEEKET